MIAKVYRALNLPRVMHAIYSWFQALMPNIVGERSGLISGRNTYLPFHFPQCYEYWLTHERLHWMAHEIVMSEDIRDFNNLPPNARAFATSVLRFFVQGDVDVAGAYHNVLIPAFSKCPEVVMMMGSIAAREAVHIDSYAKVIESVNLPQSTYEEFLSFEEMKNKHDYVHNFNTTFSYTHDVIGFIGAAVAAGVLLWALPLVISIPLTALFLVRTLNWLSTRRLERIAANIALFSGFTEGMQLFSSFAMLFSFAQKGVMKGLGSVVEWSVTDETLHTNAMIMLLNKFIDENENLNDVATDKIRAYFGKWADVIVGPRGIRSDVFMRRVHDICREMVELEDAFIDLAFNEHSSETDKNDFNGINRSQLKEFIRFIADTRLVAMRLPKIYNIERNPMPEFEELLNAPVLTNLFEGRATDYAIPVAYNWREGVWGNKSLAFEIRTSNIMKKTHGDSTLKFILPEGAEHLAPNLN